MSNDLHPRILETTASTAVRLQWPSEADTEIFAQRLAAALTQAAPSSTFIELQGELGAGKTTLVRHLLRALGVPGRIKSPTYAVVEPHLGAQGLLIHHFDFYRFADPSEWDDAGFRDIFAGPGLKLAEWPENAASRIPIPDIAIKIEATGDETARTVTLHAHTPQGLLLLQAALPP